MEKTEPNPIASARVSVLVRAQIDERLSDLESAISSLRNPVTAAGKIALSIGGNPDPRETHVSGDELRAIHLYARRPTRVDI
jgi:hypothetical protein